MKRKHLTTLAWLMAVGLAAVAGTTLTNAAGQDAKPAAPELQLPPGWTEADMQACMMAGTPGKQQELLAQDAGAWTGKNTMWMPDGSQMPVTDCTNTVTPMMDGRYVKVEMTGEMPGMGPYNGFGINGFDNVSGKYVSTWIDNHSTGIMTGTGEMSPDGKILTWHYTYTCPITKKPAVVRQIETTTGANTKTIEMYGADPKSGKEFKMMRIELTKK